MQFYLKSPPKDPKEEVNKQEMNKEELFVDEYQTHFTHLWRKGNPKGSIKSKRCCAVVVHPDGVGIGPFWEGSIPTQSYCDTSM